MSPIYILLNNLFVSKQTIILANTSGLVQPYLLYTVATMQATDGPDLFYIFNIPTEHPVPCFNTCQAHIKINKPYPTNVGTSTVYAYICFMFALYFIKIIIL